ncbi:MAG: hypothetical protein L0I24_18345 [Pseudonocardia sp.]|nr:hypothetical protein [Pseudonocardia sp.]
MSALALVRALLAGASLYLLGGAVAIGFVVAGPMLSLATFLLVVVTLALFCVPDRRPR